MTAHSATTDLKQTKTFALVKNPFVQVKKSICVCGGRSLHGNNCCRDFDIYLTTEEFILGKDSLGKRYSKHEVSRWID